MREWLLRNFSLQDNQEGQPLRPDLEGLQARVKEMEDLLSKQKEFKPLYNRKATVVPLEQ